MHYSKFTDIKQVWNGLVEQFENALLSKQVDVSCPADKTVYVLCTVYIKVYVHSMNDFISNDTVHHLLLELTTTVGFVRVADAGRVPRHIAILTTRKQDYFLKITQMSGLTQLEEERLSQGFAILHSQLI
jgi:hypothetical protein